MGGESYIFELNRSNNFNENKRSIIICCDDQARAPSFLAWSRKACACSSKSSPSRPIKSKNNFKRLGYCVLVLGLLQNIKAYETGLLAIVLLVVVVCTANLHSQ